MVNRHDGPTDEKGLTTNRRDVLKLAGATAFAAAGATGLLAGGAAAQSGEAVTSASSEVHVSPGEYTWDGDGFSVSSGGAIVGDGTPGDVVYNLEGGTMDGTIEGRLENIVVRGSNPSPKSGLDLLPGCTVDGFVWPEGCQQDEDRVFYTPEGGDDPVTLRNSAWAWSVNNGAYCDKPVMHIENCASVNNNIAGIRVGHRRGTSSGQTTVIRNTLVAVTDDILNDATNSSNARGIRIRHPGNFVIENCYFLYLDVGGAGNLIEIEDDAAGATVEIRNCTFYNEGGGSLIQDDSGGSVDIAVDGCVAAGGGSYEMQSVDSPGLSEVDDVTIPSPGALTGNPVANEIKGVGPGIGPWTQADFDGSAEPPEPPAEEPDDEPEEPEPTQHTIVLHSLPDNDVVDVSFTTDGPIEFGSDSESYRDTIVDNGDGTWTATCVEFDPDALDSFHYSGEIVDYVVPEGASVDISIDGTTTTFADVVDGGSGDNGSNDDGSGDDGSNDDGSGDGSGDGSDPANSPKVVVVDGTGSRSVAKYTFTVSGDVVRDANMSSDPADLRGWDRLQDIAKDGKVIGVVGDGIDAYRYTGEVVDVRVQGNADVSFERIDG